MCATLPSPVFHLAKVTDYYDTAAKVLIFALYIIVKTLLAVLSMSPNKGNCPSFDHALWTLSFQRDFCKIQQT